ncbi:type II CRISPR RNA-guided endonuclease Cas9 [Methanobacterium sp. YSL]|nr:type II CRISPR RNA-guided endonuclease Cas9 [Methanobacterium sp. YSL]
MDKKLILGLDIGITSVGWGIINEQNQIIKAGVRLFEEADSENNKKRRSFRGQRRLKNRKKLRILDMRQLLFKHGYIPTIDYIPTVDPYQSRLKGLTEKLSKDELASALIQFSKRRGSNLETVEESKNEESPKFILQKHDNLLVKDKHVVHLQIDARNQFGAIRGHENVYRTNQYESEIKQILASQQVSEDFIKSVLSIIRRRRHFSEGPGSLKSPTPYGRYRSIEPSIKHEIISSFNEIDKNRYKKEKFTINYKDTNYLVLSNGDIINKDPLNLIEIMRGKCSIYPEELRAPKNAVSAEIYNLLNDLTNLTIISQENRKLSKEEKKNALNYLLQNGYFKPKGAKGLLKLLNLDQSDVKGFRVNNKEEALITELEGYFKIKKALSNVINPDDYSIEFYDTVAEVLTSTLVIDERRKLMEPLNLNSSELKTMSELTGINGYHAFSLKALRILNQELLQDDYNAQQIIKLTDKLNISNKLSLSENVILSPVARRAQQEAFKVVDALMKEFGQFDRIVVETTRDKNSKEQAANIRDRQKKQEKSKLDAETELKNLIGDSSIDFKPIMIQKMRLYKEQNGKCAYSGIQIDLHKLITDPKAYEVDHIIPFSISLDDSYNNKVLIAPLANQIKGNLTPFSYFKSGKVDSRFVIKNYETFKEIVMNNQNISKYKRANLLDERDITKYDVMKEFVNRNLVDTSYAIRTFMMTLKQYFENHDINTSVTTIKGKQTDLFRSIARTQWFRDHQDSEDRNPFEKNRNFYSHHAIDALIIAGLSNQKLFNYLFNVAKNESGLAHDPKTGELFEADPKKDSSFFLFSKSIANLEESDIRFSWKKDTKPNRSISDQSIYSTRNIDGVHYIVNTYENIYGMDKDKLSKIFNEKNKKKLLMYHHDKKSYELVEKAFKQYSHEQKPFLTYEQNHGKLRKHGIINGPIITNLKYYESKLGSHIDITKNLSSKRKVVLLSMSTYRVDIYKSIQGNYKFVTVRPNEFRIVDDKFHLDKTVYNNKMIEKGIDNQFEFQFSLNRNEIVEILYFDGTKKTVRFISSKDDPKNILEFKSIDHVDTDRIAPTIGKTIVKITKYYVGITGKRYIAKKETLKMQI